MQSTGLCVVIHPNNYGVVDDKNNYVSYAVRMNHHPLLGRGEEAGGHLDAVHDHFDAHPSHTLGLGYVTATRREPAQNTFDIDFTDRSPAKPARSDIFEVTARGHVAEPMIGLLKDLEARKIPFYNFDGEPRTADELIREVQAAIEETKEKMPETRRLWDPIVDGYKERARAGLGHGK